ncbi:unnamed protein product [Tenebrio molitor]|nr:unnamed protein product [Tenebrio molitor]
MSRDSTLIPTTNMATLHDLERGDGSGIGHGLLHRSGNSREFPLGWWKLLIPNEAASERCDRDSQINITSKSLSAAILNFVRALQNNEIQ